MTNGAKATVLAVITVAMALQVGFNWLFANVYAAHGRAWDFWVMMGFSALYWGFKGIAAWWKSH